MLQKQRHSLFLLFALLCCMGAATAQSISLQERQGSLYKDSKSHYPQILHHTASGGLGAVMMYEKGAMTKRVYVCERYDKAGKRIYSMPVPFEGVQGRYVTPIEAFWYGDTLSFVSAHYAYGEKVLRTYLTRVAPDGSALGTTLLLETDNNDSSRGLYALSKVSYSEDSSTCAIVMSLPTEQKYNTIKRKFQIMVLDRDMKVQWQKVIESGINPEDAVLKNVLLCRDGRVLFTTTDKKEVAAFLCSKDGKAKRIDIKVKSKGDEVLEHFLFRTEHDDRVQFVAGFGESEERAVQVAAIFDGYLLGEIDLTKGSFQTQQSDFSPKLLGDYFGTVLGSKGHGIVHLRLIHALRTKAGDVYLVLERIFEDEGSSIAVLRLSPERGVVDSWIVPKRNKDGYWYKSGVAVVLVGDVPVLFYNSAEDNLTKEVSKDKSAKKASVGGNSRMVYATLLPKGKVQQQMIERKKYAGHHLVPHVFCWNGKQLDLVEAMGKERRMVRYDLTNPNNY